MDYQKDELLQTNEQADALMTYSENSQPFEEAELEALEQAFNASKDYLELGYPRF
jgi:tryptophan synthase alpha subunit